MSPTSHTYSIVIDQVCTLEHSVYLQKNQEILETSLSFEIHHFIHAYISYVNDLKLHASHERNSFSNLNIVLVFAWYFMMDVENIAHLNIILRFNACDPYRSHPSLLMFTTQGIT